MNWNANDTTQLVRAALIDRQGSDAVAKSFNTPADRCGQRLIELAGMNREQLGQVVPPDCIAAVQKWAQSSECANLRARLGRMLDSPAIVPVKAKAESTSTQERVTQTASAKVASRGVVCCPFCCGARVTIYKDCNFSQTINLRFGDESAAEAVMT